MGGKTLLVSPDPGLLHQLRTGLEEAEIEVFVASSYADAAKAARAVLPDIVLVAATIPGGTGADLARELRAASFPGKIVLIEDIAGDSRVTMAPGATVDAVLRRPIRVGDALDCIGQLLDDIADGDGHRGVGASTGAFSLVEPPSGMFAAGSSQYSVEAIESIEDRASGGAGMRTEDLPALAVEPYEDEAPARRGNPGPPPTPVRELPRPGRGHASAGSDIDAAIDRRFGELLGPGGELTQRIEAIVRSAVESALADAVRRGRE